MKTFLTSAAVVLLCCGAQTPEAVKEVSALAASFSDIGARVVHESADNARPSSGAVDLLVLEGSVALLSI